MSAARTEFLALQYDAENPCVPIITEETSGLNVQLIDTQCPSGAADGCLVTLDVGLPLDNRVTIVRHDGAISHDASGSRLLIHTWGTWSTIRVAIIGVN